MKPVLKKGKLKTWKDDRGFGFIKPDNGGNEVFLHITVMKRASRRPKPGDTILYESATEADGKVRATRASIQGAAPQPLPTQRKNGKRVGVGMAMGIGILAALVLMVVQFNRGRSLSPVSSVPQSVPIPQPEPIPQTDCVIKGNISINTEKRLYHLPGMEDYETTVIDPVKGERWFCSESEAIANGWEKAPN
ncbi:cold shock domain-containing protein [Spirulina major CS-329]|uniref:cold-shock protein n=1 Tax=Spirulina TaxID=1154 RepID=UPI00232B5E1D|nr:MULTISPECIES: cold shock domain-containing protein [Spirulina]MDB9494499.1 cold shock domain-containing protein [Spirulina subsalsa CS-330]MDB9502790.1 cold shock domain-containing protein [Spirulina major CS-329]